MSFHADRYRSDDPDRKFTMSAVWVKQLRPRFLAAHRLCEHCKALGIIRVATSVDHVQRPRGDSVLQRSESNWQALCAACHNRKSNWERTMERTGKRRPLVLGCTADGYPVETMDGRAP